MMWHFFRVKRGRILHHGRDIIWCSKGTTTTTTIMMMLWQESGTEAEKKKKIMAEDWRRDSWRSYLKSGLESHCHCWESCTGRVARWKDVACNTNFIWYSGCKAQWMKYKIQFLLFRRWEFGGVVTSYKGDLYILSLLLSDETINAIKECNLYHAVQNVGYYSMFGLIHSNTGLSPRRSIFRTKTQGIPNNILYLTVLLPSHISSPFPECLSLHIDAVFANESHTALTAGVTALTRALSIILGMGGVKLVGNACLSHDYIYFAEWSLCRMDKSVVKEQRRDEDGWECNG